MPIINAFLIFALQLNAGYLTPQFGFLICRLNTRLLPQKLSVLRDTNNLFPGSWFKEYDMSLYETRRERKDWISYHSL